MNFIALDLEFNQPSQKIIQIGAVVGDIDGNILEKLDILIDPNEVINPYIVDLCGITDEDIEQHGVSLEEGYDKVQQLHAKYQCIRNPIVWGGGDSASLRNELEKQGHSFSNGYGDTSNSPPFCFGFRWIDVKTLYQVHRIRNKLPLQGGLAKSMTKMGMKFEGTKHNATDDALNTFRMFLKLLEI